MCHGSMSDVIPPWGRCNLHVDQREQHPAVPVWERHCSSWRTCLSCSREENINRTMSCGGEAPRCARGSPPPVGRRGAERGRNPSRGGNLAGRSGCHRYLSRGLLSRGTHLSFSVHDLIGGDTFSVVKMLVFHALKGDSSVFLCSWLCAHPSLGPVSLGPSLGPVGASGAS